MFADVVFTTETMVVVSALVLGLCGVVAKLYLNLRADHDARLKEKDEQISSWKQMTKEATSNLERAAIIYGPKADPKQVPIPLVAPVVAEHSSPVTPSQEATAEMATERAKLVAATLKLGLHARPPSSEKGPEAFLPGRADK